MWDLLVKEVRGALKEHGWKLRIYNDKKYLKSKDANGICDEEEKTISLAVKGKGERDRIGLLAHEFAHFLQAKTMSKKAIKKVDEAYMGYAEFEDGKLSDAKKISETRKGVIDYEYDAELRAYHWMQAHGYEFKDYARKANSYNLILRYYFETRHFITSYKQRDRIEKALKVSREWLTSRKRRARLSRKEKSIIKKILSEKQN